MQGRRRARCECDLDARGAGQGRAGQGRAGQGRAGQGTVSAQVGGGRRVDTANFTKLGVRGEGKIIAQFAGVLQPSYASCASCATA